MAASAPRAMSRLVILLPTLNEEEGVSATIADLHLEDIRALGFEPQILVVDGHSSDATVAVAESAGATVITQQGKGKGAAVREGMDWALARAVPYVAVLDADHTYPGSALTAMVTLLDAGSDMVIGVRRPDRHAMSTVRGLVHRIGNAGLNFLAGYLSGGPVLDVCSGLWGVRTSIFSDMSLVSEGFDIEAEAFVKAFRQGLAISQLPVAYRDRIGTAKLHAFQDGSRILLSILRYASRVDAPPSSPHHAPPETPDVLPGTTLRDLQSILFALNSPRVFVSAAPEGSDVVDELVRKLGLGYSSIRVERSSLTGESAVAPTDIGPTRPTYFGSALTEPWTIVIDLPSRPIHRAERTANIQIPSGQRKIYIDFGSEGGTARPTPQGAARSGVYKLERASLRPLSPLRLLSSSLAQFGHQRDLALISANVAHTDFTVFRERTKKPPSGAETSSGPERASGSIDGGGAANFE